MRLRIAARSSLSGRHVKPGVRLSPASSERIAPVAAFSNCTPLPVRPSTSIVIASSAPVAPRDSATLPSVTSVPRARSRTTTSAPRLVRPQWSIPAKCDVRAVAAQQEGLDVRERGCRSRREIHDHDAVPVLGRRCLGALIHCAPSAAPAATSSAAPSGPIGLGGWVDRIDEPAPVLGEHGGAAAAHDPGRVIGDGPVLQLAPAAAAGDGVGHPLAVGGERCVGQRLPPGIVGRLEGRLR